MVKGRIIMDKKSNRTASNIAEGTRLTITASEAHLPKFFRLIQSGFKIKAATGVTIKAFLCEQVGLPEDYFEERIQTLFLDSKPVDDVATTRIKDGTRLALSAAMPGVAGALFRKGGRYSAMRKGISYTQQDTAADEEAGWVTVRLFNLILKEMGPLFLAKGVWVEGKAVHDFFSQPPEGLFDAIMQISLNGKSIESLALAACEWPEQRVLVKITAQ